MKKINNNLKLLTYIATILITLNSTVFAYPPDPANAALLYYQAFLLCGQPNDVMEATLKDVLENRIDPNVKVVEYVKKFKQAIRLATIASEIPHCDWGLKYSDALAMEMPYLGHTRILTFLMICDARILAKNGDFKTALDRCLAAQRMARHHGDSTDVGYLMGISISKRSSACIQDVLSQMPANLEILDWLGEELNSIDRMPFSEIASAEKTTSVFRTYMNKDKAKELLQMPGFGLDCIEDANEEFFQQNARYWDNYTAKVMSALALPYLQAYPELVRLEKEYIVDANANPSATLTRALSPASAKIHNISVVGLTNLNAVKTAVEIYLIKAQTGKLPDSLPPSLPADLFSDKPFIYEKTPDGFLLRCQGKDLDKNETYEYKFKIKK